MELDQIRELLKLEVLGPTAVAILSLALNIKLLRERQTSFRDPLTYLYNRRYGEDALEKAMNHFSHDGHGFSLLYLDIDYFKETNDKIGHHAGDIVLQAVANEITKNIRREDTAVRWGGEELIALLQESDKQQALKKAELILENIRAIQPGQRYTLERGKRSKTVIIPKQITQITASIGVANINESSSVDGLVKLADSRMYNAKHAGRNRIAGN